MTTDASLWKLEVCQRVSPERMINFISNGTRLASRAGLDRIDFVIDVWLCFFASLVIVAQARLLRCCPRRGRHGLRLLQTLFQLTGCRWQWQNEIDRVQADSCRWGSHDILWHWYISPLRAFIYVSLCLCWQWPPTGPLYTKLWLNGFGPTKQSCCKTVFKWFRIVQKGML